MNPLTLEWVEKVKFRYPGESADKHLAQKAVNICKIFRQSVRQSLGLHS